MKIIEVDIYAYRLTFTDASSSFQEEWWRAGGTSGDCGSSFTRCTSAGRTAFSWAGWKEDREEHCDIGIATTWWNVMGTDMSHYSDNDVFSNR